MKKKMRYDRFIIVGISAGLLLFMIVYMMLHRIHIEEYDGNIETLVASYRQDDKIYTFDLKAFQQKQKWYLSLNDMYNMMVILDKNSRVYLDTNKHILIYELSDGTYYFHYGQQKIVYNNDSIDLKKNGENIYISHKNVYISVSFIEKIILKDKKSIKIENKNAIIA